MSENCGQLASGGTNGAFYEAQNEAANHPQVVDAMVKEKMRFLNKVVRTTKEGILLEADPRHAELVIKELGAPHGKPRLCRARRMIRRDRPATCHGTPRRKGGRFPMMTAMTPSWARRRHACVGAFLPH